jgi:hypothetical protein
MKKPLIRFCPSREEIIARDTSAIAALLDPKKLTQSQLRTLKGRVTIGFDSIGAEGRAVFEIPEVRRYAEQLRRDFPYWFFYFPLDIACLWLFTASVLPTLIVVRKAPGGEGLSAYNVSELRDFVETLTPATKAICRRARLSTALQDNLLEDVRQYYGNRTLGLSNALPVV